MELTALTTGQKNGPPGRNEKSSKACTSSQVTSFGRPQTHKRNAMSLKIYVTAKSSEKSEKQASRFRSKKRAPKKDDDMEITTNIGLKRRFDGEDLKTVRGKCLQMQQMQLFLTEKQLPSERHFTGDLRQLKSMY